MHGHTKTTQNTNPNSLMSNLTTTVDSNATQSPRAVTTISALAREIYTPDTHPTPVEPVTVVSAICDGVGAIEHLTAVKQLTQTLTETASSPDTFPGSIIAPETLALAHIAYAEQYLHASSRTIAQLLDAESTETYSLTGDCHHTYDQLSNVNTTLSRLSTEIPVPNDAAALQQIESASHTLPAPSATTKIATTIAEGIAQLNIGLTDAYGYLVVAPNESIQPVHTSAETAFRAKAKKATVDHTSLVTTPIAQPESSDEYIPTAALR